MARAAATQEGGLTVKQEEFVLAYLEKGNATDAYRRVYSTKGMNDGSINRAAKELLDNPKIASRVQTLRKPVAEKAQLTLEQHLEDLKRLRDMAEASEKYGPAIQAEVARGKASGLYVEKVEHSGQIGIAEAIRASRSNGK